MANPQPDRAFFRKAILDTIVPETSQARLPEALDDTVEAGAQDDGSLIPIKQRDRLFFDETLTVFVVLRIANGSAEALTECLPRLDIKLEVHAINNFQSQPDPQESGDHEAPARDLIFSDHIKNNRDPFIAVNESEDDNEPTVLAIWELEATLHRPRTRFPNLAVTFTASASLTRSEQADESTSDDDCLPSLVPAPTNILERLNRIPALQDRPPYLPASRIESVLPGPQLDSETLHIRHQPTKCIPVSPAVSARIRCSRMTTNSPRPTTIACLDFEVTRFATFNVLLNHANVSLASDGKIELLSPIELPITCRSRDTITFLYKVRPTANLVENPLPLPSASLDAVGLLDIMFESTLQISKTCKPTITMRWRSNVEFSPPPNARFGPTSQVLQRPNRPNSLPLSSTASIVNLPNSRPSTPPKDSRPTSLITSTTNTSTHFTGLTISFTAPSTVPIGRIFTYTLMLTNHSPRPLKLAIIPIPRRPPASTLPPHKHAPKPSASSAIDRRHISNPTPSNPNMMVDIAPAVTDENIVHALQKASINTHSDTELVPISTDVRVGPLGPGACHEVQLKMLGLRVGVLRLEMVRVVDLAREQEVGGSGVVDVRGEILPEVVVVDAGGEGVGMGVGSWNGSRISGGVLRPEKGGEK